MKREKFFTLEEEYLMQDHNVPYDIAYQRVKFQGMDRQEAMTKPLRWTKTKQVKVPIVHKVYEPHELNWKR